MFAENSVDFSTFEVSSRITVENGAEFDCYVHGAGFSNVTFNPLSPDVYSSCDVFLRDGTEVDGHKSFCFCVEETTDVSEAAKGADWFRSTHINIPITKTSVLSFEHMFRNVLVGEWFAFELRAFASIAYD